MVAETQELPSDVADFVQEHGLGDGFRTAVELVYEFFPETRAIYPRLLWNPENGKRWVELRTTILGITPDHLARESRLLMRLNQRLPFALAQLIDVAFTTDE